MSLHDNQTHPHANIACVIVAPRQSSSRRDCRNGHPDCRCVPIQIVALQTVREATDESLRRNEKTHLEVQQGDKAEEAWKRTLLGWGSKHEVVKLTGCGEGTVAKMRRANKCHRDYNKKPQSDADRLWGEKLRMQLGADLRAHAWNKVNGVLLDLTAKEWDMNDDAAKLARNITMRLTNKLSEDPEVTARALWLYDRDLCPKLIAALQEYIREQETEERDLEDQAAYEKLNETH